MKTNRNSLDCGSDSGYGLNGNGKCLNNSSSFFLRKFGCVTLCCFLLISYGCWNSDNPNPEASKNVGSDTLPTESDVMGIRIDASHTRVIQTVYVTDRQGVDIKQRPDENSVTLGNYEYGTRLEVIEIRKNWLGIRDRIKREFMKNNQKNELTGWEKVYVLRSKTGMQDEIALTFSDLTVITSLTTNKRTEDFETTEHLTKFLKLELIDQPLFDQMKKHSVNFLTTDSAAYQKKNGILELNCEKKIVKLIDKPEAEESIQEFIYAGQIDFLNQYLIGGTYWERFDYKFIDKTSGKTTAIFNEFPHIG